MKEEGHNSGAGVPGRLGTARSVFEIAELTVDEIAENATSARWSRIRPGRAAPRVRRSPRAGVRPRLSVLTADAVTVALKTALVLALGGTYGVTAYLANPKNP
jgi:hypothetical protein